MPIAHSASFRRSAAAAEASRRKPLSMRYGIWLRADIKRSFFREFISGHTAAISIEDYLLRFGVERLTMPGLERLRLSSIEPLEVVPELIDLVATHPRLAHHFHIPLQSGSPRILRAMYRPYSPSTIAIWYTVFASEFPMPRSVPM